MAVHINEIVIRANVVEPTEQTKGPVSQPSTGIDREAIIRECTEIILEILKRKTER